NGHQVCSPFLGCFGSQLSDKRIIYHNICYQHRLRGPQGVSDGKPVKQATNHPKTRQKRAGSVFTACMSMRASA
ncbi:hypothetical protein PXW76_27505, partial [Klebsiella pneumoniae]|uniref:hypothetical protein n=1 Tax=Klebsiella pneumoniae TaxID=573 RepID=UPI002380F0F0